MEILETLLGGSRRGSGLTGRFSRWIVSCGCVLVAAIMLGVALLIVGVLRIGTDSANILMVVLMIIVAVASLIRSQV